MKTLQTFIAITLLSLFTVSCSNDGDSDTAKPVVLLTKVIKSSGHTIYDYDDNNKLILVEDVNPGFSTYKTTFVYNSNGKIEESLTVQEGGIYPSPPVKKTYLYDAQNRLIEKKHFQASLKNPALYDYLKSDFFEYNGSQITFKSQKKESNIPDTRIIYDFDTKGNIVKTVAYSQMSANNPNGLIFFTDTSVYDDKFNPETSLPSEYTFPNFTKNNEVKLTTLMSNQTYIIDYAYEYNEDGYVKKRTSSGQSDVTYEYKKI